MAYRCNLRPGVDVPSFAICYLAVIVCLSSLSQLKTTKTDVRSQRDCIESKVEERNTPTIRVVVEYVYPTESTFPLNRINTDRYADSLIM